MRLLPGFTLLLALAGAGEPTAIQFPEECGILRLSTHGRYLVGSNYPPVMRSWIARVDSGKLVLDKALHRAEVSEDELFAAGLDDQGFIIVVDLKAGTQRKLNKLGPFLFSPKGHTLAFWTSQLEPKRLPEGGSEPLPAGYSIDLYDAATGNTTQLAQFLRDIPKGKTYPLQSLELLQWADDAIRLVAHYSVGNGVAVLLNPITDVASTNSEERPWKRKLLADGSQIEVVPANDMYLISYIENKERPQLPKTIFGHDITGEAVCNLQYDFSPVSNRLLVWSSNPAGDKQSLWLEDLSTLKAQRLLEALFYDWTAIMFDLSEDGDWIACSDPKDSKKVIVIPAPKVGGE